jgi:hypothetical protein
MKKIAVATILLLYTFIQLGIMGWHYYKPIIHAICYNQFLLRKESPDNIFIVKTDTATYQQSRQKDDEIVWKGVLYDIKNVVIKDKEVTITMEQDIAETSLMNICHNIHEQIKKNTLPGSPTDISFYQWIFKFYKPAEDSKLLIAVLSITPKNSLYYSNYFSSFFPNGPFQPPDFMI